MHADNIREGMNRKPRYKGEAFLQIFPLQFGTMWCCSLASSLLCHQLIQLHLKITPPPSADCTPALHTTHSYNPPSPILFPILFPKCRSTPPFPTQPKTRAAAGQWSPACCTSPTAAPAAPIVSPLSRASKWPESIQHCPRRRHLGACALVWP